MIYFIQNTETKAIKIGVSRQPLERLRDLQTAQSSKLILLGIMDGSLTEEKVLHRQFTHRHGEWFEPTKELLFHIQRNAISLADFDRPVVEATFNRQQVRTAEVSLMQRAHEIRDVLMVIAIWGMFLFVILWGTYRITMYLYTIPWIGFVVPILTVIDVIVGAMVIRRIAIKYHVTPR